MSQTTPDILIVDDVEYNVLLLTDILEDQGFSVATANGGQQALHLARSLHPKLMLLDIMMPDLSGLEVCRQLQADEATRDIPIIFVSALSDKDDETEGFSAGCVDYISKPICEPVVVARVKTHLELSELRHNLEEQVQQRSESLNATLRDLARSNQVKEEFFATLSHELRTPLNAINGSLNLLKESNLDSDQLYLLKTGTQGSEELHYLIDNLLKLNEAIAGNLSLQEEPFALRTSLTPLIEQATRHANLKAIQFDATIDDAVPEYLIGDSSLILQAIAQLVSNAIKFTQKGGVKLTINCDNNTQQPQLIFAIHDSGIGIKEKKQSMIFDHFQQAETAFNRRHSGLGIGLTLCHHFIHLLNGYLHFESEHHKGSTFSFTVPLAVDTNKTNNQPPENTQPISSPESCTVLIVEDNAINLMIQEKIVQKEGFKTLSACDGKEALRVFNEAHIDAILMDCQMPVIDGFDTTIAIRRIEDGRRHVPIIAVTANANSHDREHCLNVGMDDYMTKPIVASELVEKLHYWLGQTLTAQSA